MVWVYILWYAQIPNAHFCHVLRFCHVLQLSANKNREHAQLVGNSLSPTSVPSWTVTQHHRTQPRPIPPIPTSISAASPSDRATPAEPSTDDGAAYNDRVGRPVAIRRRRRSRRRRYGTRYPRPCGRRRSCGRATPHTPPRRTGAMRDEYLRMFGDEELGYPRRSLGRGRRGSRSRGLGIPPHSGRRGGAPAARGAARAAGAAANATGGDTTTSRGGQETTAPKNERGATRDSGVKRDGGMVERGALAWRQWRISGGGGQRTRKQQQCNNQMG